MPLRRSIPVLLALVSAFALSACEDDPTSPSTVFPSADTYSADVPLAWGELSLTLTKETPGFTPPVASRAFGYLGLALYEALVPGMPGYQSLAGRVNRLDPLSEAEFGDGYHWPTVANSALATMARYLYPNATPDNLVAIDHLEEQFAGAFASTVDGDVFTRSVTRGRTTADAIFIYSLTDKGHEGYLRNFPGDYVPPVGPGLWVPTPQMSGNPPLPALQPYWGQCRPFALPTFGNPNLACDPGPPPAFSTEPGSAFHDEAMEVFEAAVNATQEQKEIAFFWADDPGVTPTPPGHTMALLFQLSEAEGEDLAFLAEAFAKTGMAVCDAFIACWHSKFEYNLLRPITYIQEHIDPDWNVIVNTPPFPEYTSGHSVQSGAGFSVLSDLFGESYAFTDHTHDDLGFTPRSFDSFDAAAEEAAISRLYGGIHFRSAIDLGVEQGRCVGEAILALPFRRPAS
jgi:hypothetical protein